MGQVAARERPAGGAFGAWAALVGLSLLFFHGVLATSDEQLMAETARSIAERFSLVFDRELYGQRFTGYGIGTPIIGVPAYLLEKMLSGSIFLRGSGSSLLPLTNAVLLGFLGVLGATLLEGERRWLAVVIAMAASPMLPASTTFYSELLSSVGLVGLAACLMRSGDGGGSARLALAAGACALAAMLARTAMAPLLGICLLWGWRLGADRRALLGGIAGIALGVLAALAVNWVLRGNPLSTGYEGQAFSTPLATGLHGLLTSPERGLLVFFPVAIVPILCWGHLGGRARSVLALAVAVTLFSLVFHGQFWTWHGGWTSGPRFLLPCVALLAVAVAGAIERRRHLPQGLQLTLSLALIWSGLMAYIYARHAPIDWWNHTWGFHREENEWLFLPQLSLWQAWLEGAPLPDVAVGLTKALRITMDGLGVVLIIIALVPLTRELREHVGLKPKGLLGIASDGVERSLLIAMAYLVGLLAVNLMSGPRGWKSGDGAPPPAGRPQHLLLDGEGGTWEGWLEYPLNGGLKLHTKSNAPFQIEIDEAVVHSQTGTDPGRMALGEVSLDLARGTHLIRVTIGEPAPNIAPRFELYWTWAGGGRYLAPAGGEYVTPRPLSPVEQFCTRIWRLKFTATAALLALVLLLSLMPAKKMRESLI